MYIEKLIQGHNNKQNKNKIKTNSCAITMSLFLF